MQELFQEMRVDEIELARNRLERLYDSDPRPWYIGYSGGKDSTLLLQLVCEVRESRNRSKDIFVCFNDTLYECADKPKRIHTAFERFEKIGLKTHITKPDINKTILVSIIGRGYPPPIIGFGTVRRIAKFSRRFGIQEKLLPNTAG